MKNKNSVSIDENLVQRLVAIQFPQWKHLTIKSVANQGWDNRTFHLGNEMLIRLPSDNDYANQVEKEHYWLPKLRPFLPLAIPEPLALGEPTDEYSWKWSIYRFIPGESAATAKITSLSDCACVLAEFLIALHQIDTTGGPLSGFHSFYRGGSLSVYDAETKKAIAILQKKIDTESVFDIWENALRTTWNKPPVWVHGDISAGNLLLQNGRLNAIIDFGQLSVGDPACDLVIAWTLFKDKSRDVFQDKLSLDKDTWDRGRAWALWKALITASGLTNPNNVEAARCMQIINEVIADYKNL